MEVGTGRHVGLIRVFSLGKHEFWILQCMRALNFIAFEAKLFIIDATKIAVKANSKCLGGEKRWTRSRRRCWILWEFTDLLLINDMMEISILNGLLQSNDLMWERLHLLCEFPHLSFLDKTLHNDNSERKTRAVCEMTLLLLAGGTWKTHQHDHADGVLQAEFLGFEWWESGQRSNHASYRRLQGYWHEFVHSWLTRNLLDLNIFRHSHHGL